MSYLRFAAMIATSTLVMFGLMYLNTYAFEHVFWSETRVYMAFLMGATMAIIMLGFMLSMYQNKKLNIGIFIGSAIVFALALWLVRSQSTVSQTSYMRAMIPHHSIAIMTSERSQITDPRVRKLADEIIEAQEREIAEMRYLIRALEDKESAMQPEIYREPQAKVGSLTDALASAAIAPLDPKPMKDAEYAKLLPGAPGCAFSYTAGGRPILVARASAPRGVAAEGVIKLSGTLIPLRATNGDGFEGLSNGARLQADGVRLSVQPLPDAEPEAVGGARRWEANLLFELEQGLTVGYGGYYTCTQ